MFRKIGLFFLSLWLLFLFIIIITIDIPICLSPECKFIGFKSLILNNLVPLFSIIALLIGFISYYDFSFVLKGSTHMPFKIIEIENIEYEHLTFLTTYIIPLVCFNFFSIRYIIVLVILLIVIGVIYIKTDLFYANPTLALLNYRIYKINGKFKEGERKNIIIISREDLTVNQRCDYIKLDNRIYYAKLKL